MESGRKGSTAFSHRTTRLYDRRNIKSLLEQLVAEMCADAGVRYSGIQKGFGITADLALFSDTQGSTCALPIDGLTPEAIRAKVAASDEGWRASRASA